MLRESFIALGVLVLFYVAGPSALATVMIMIMAAQSTSDPLAGLARMTLAWFITAVLLVLGVVRGSSIPPRILTAFERFSGLLLAVIAVHRLMTGIQSYPVVAPSRSG